MYHTSLHFIFSSYMVQGTYRKTKSNNFKNIMCTIREIYTNFISPHNLCAEQKRAYNKCDTFYAFFSVFLFFGVVTLLLFIHIDNIVLQSQEVLFFKIKFDSRTIYLVKGKQNKRIKRSSIAFVTYK